MKRFRVIDFETTDLPPNAAIIEIGYTDVIWDGPSMTVSPETFSTLTDPGKAINPNAQAIHHIDAADLIGKPHPSTVLETISEGVDFFVAHNAKFEQELFGTEIPWICTMKCAKILIADLKSYAIQSLRYNLALKVDRERTLPPHRAGPDTYVTAELLVYLMQQAVQLEGGQFVNAMVKWSNTARLLDTLPFGKHQGIPCSQIPRSYWLWLKTNANPDEDVRHTMNHYLGTD